MTTRFGIVFAAAAIAVAATAAQNPPAGVPPEQMPPPPATYTRRILGVVNAATKVEVVESGFRGTEGPIAMPDGSLLFTETQANRITRIAPDGAISTFLETTNGANGLAWDADGRLIAVQTTPGQTRVGVIYPANRVQTITDNYQGRPYGRPNDLVVNKSGGVYFTDPGPNAQQGKPAANALPPAVYYVPPGGAAIKVAEGIRRPNGIMLDRGERTLYVNDTLGEYLIAFDVKADGTLFNQRNFARYQGRTTTDEGVTQSGADGLAIDSEGRIFAATAAGVEIFGMKGNHLGVIPVGRQPQNLAFAGPGKKTLYIVGRGSVFKVDLLIGGFPGRAK